MFWGVFFVTPLTPLFNLPTVIHEIFRHYKICSDHNEKKLWLFQKDYIAQKILFAHISSIS